TATLAWTEAGDFESFSFSPDGKYLAAGGNQKTKIFETAAGKQVGTISAVGLLCFSPDSTRLVFGSRGRASFHDTVTGRELKTVSLPMDDRQPDELHSFTYSPDGKHLLCFQ